MDGIRRDPLATRDAWDAGSAGNGPRVPLKKRARGGDSDLGWEEYRRPSAALVIYFQAEPPVLSSFCRRVSRVPAVARSSGVSRHVGASRTPSRECDDVEAVALGDGGHAATGYATGGTGG